MAYPTHDEISKVLIQQGWDIGTLVGEFLELEEKAALQEIEIEKLRDDLNSTEDELYKAQEAVEDLHKKLGELDEEAKQNAA